MARGRKTDVVVAVTVEQRKILESWRRSTKISAGLARRGRVILLRADGVSMAEIARVAGISRRFVYKWIERFRAEGVIGLEDKPGRGKKGRCVVTPMVVSDASDTAREGVGAYTGA